MLSDPTRLRILALLAREALSVAELQEVLNLGQSRISSHLSLLRRRNLVQDRRDGKKTFYSLHPDPDPVTRHLIETSVAAAGKEPEIREDRTNLKRILRKRKQKTEAYFNTIAGRLGRNYCPGRSWEAIGHLLLLLTPPLKIADLGAGEGLVSQLLARRAEYVYCIDNSKRMVEVGRELAAKNGLKNLTYLFGDIEEVPLADGSIDLAILSQALHHAIHPSEAVKEAFRILKPGGQLVILDLKEHDFEKARELYADLWLGFSENSLYRFCEEAGFRDIEVTAVSKEKQEPYFTTLRASAVKV